MCHNERSLKGEGTKKEKFYSPSISIKSFTLPPFLFAIATKIPPK